MGRSNVAACLSQGALRRAQETTWEGTAAITVQTLALGVIGIPFYLTVRARRRRPVAMQPRSEAAMEVA